MFCKLVKNENRMSRLPIRNIEIIGAARFELATSRPPAVRATKLRHTPLKAC